MNEVANVKKLAGKKSDVLFYVVACMFCPFQEVETILLKR